MRNVFLGSILLSVLVALHLTLLRQSPGRLGHIVRVSFPPLLLWSFVITGYAFYSLWGISAYRGKLLDMMAATDAKTGVRSLDYIKTRLEEEYQEALQTGQPSAVLYVDLDNLEMVNRNFGRAVGDVLLKEVARAIESSVPPGSDVGHVGGDEFVIVLPATKPQEARPVLFAIEKGIKNCKLELGKRGWVGYLGCRIGVAAWPGEARSANDIIRVAQQAADQSRTQTG